MRQIIFIAIMLFVFTGVTISQNISQNKEIKPPSNVTELPDTVYRRAWALIIGIDKYLYLSPSLNYAVKDAEAVYDLLINKFGYSKENIIILKNEQATRDGIREAINFYAEKNMVDKKDSVLIYFSGHGQTVELPDGGDIGFIIPYDANVNLPNNPKESPNLAKYSNQCIGMNELRDMRDKTPAKHLLFLVDSCYSGLAIPTSKGALPKFLKHVAKERTQEIITAGGKNEQSLEKSILGHGIFTYYLIKGLEDNSADSNNDSVVIGSELAVYVSNEVRAYTSGAQNPLFGRNDEGEFMFIQQICRGNLNITLNPSDAKVKIVSLKDKSKSYDLPLSGEIELDVGQYIITGDKVIDEQVEITRGDKIYKVLRPKPASIINDNMSQNMDIIVDDRPIGSLPYELPSGSHKISIKKDGFHIETTITLEPAQTLSPIKIWNENTGSIKLISNPSVSKVTVTRKDDPTILPLPDTNRLPAGEYTLTVEKDGYVTDAKSIEVKVGVEISISITLLGYYDDTKKIDNKTTELNVILKPKKTTLYVEVDPPEGFISIKGVAEEYKKINLSDATPGDYTVIAHLADFETKTINLTLNPGDEKHERITLERVKVILQIDSNPQGASVKLDGFEHGITPLTFEDVPTGEHNLTLVLKNYESISKNITVNSVPQPLAFQFHRSKGTVMVKSTPSGAAVDFVDNAQKRIYWQELTPALVKIDNGEYTLELSKLDYRTTSKKITINDGTNPEIIVTLQENGPFPPIIEDTSLITPTDNLKAIDSDKVITKPLSFLPYIKSLEHNNINCGSIRLYVSPSDANIYLDEKPIANLGIDDSVILQSETKILTTFHNLFPGTHTILVTKKNHNSALNYVMVKPGISTNLDVKLHNKGYFQLNVLVWISIVAIAAVSAYYFVY